MSRFIQIHTLTSYPASLLNRDDVGFAKRIPFGGETRTRISSQCLKRHWRTFEGAHSLGALAPMSVRSRLTFEQLIHRPLVAAGFDPALARAVTEALVSTVLGKSEKSKSKDEAEVKKAKPKAKKGAETGADEGAPAEAAPAEKGGVQTAQVTVLGPREMEYFLGHAKAVCEAKPDPAKAGDAVLARLKDAKKNLDAIKLSAGLDAALFGRMVTSDILSRGDAALHVAHALTVHKESSETDYFSAVDDLLRDGDDAQMGSGHIGTTELTSGLFYGYVVVDVPLLVSNLEGCDRAGAASADRTLAAKVVEELVHLVATVSPGAKLGSTAPHAYAQCVLVEHGDAQPRTLANAFLRPVNERPDLLGNTYRALSGHLRALDEMYERSTQRAHAAIDPDGLIDASVAGERQALGGVARWAASAVQGQ